MSDLRAKSTNLCMADAMPFNQHFEYWDTWPVEDMLNSAFFLPLRSMFRPGDQVCISRFDDKRENLLEVVTVRVVRKVDDPATKRVDLLQVSDIYRPENTPEDGAPYIKRGFGNFVIKIGDETLSEHKTRDEAEQALNELQPAA